jgi:malate/lactate dehydrogenase
MAWRGLGGKGLEGIPNLELNSDEQAAFQKSCDAVKELVEALKKLQY